MIKIDKDKKVSRINDQQQGTYLGAFSAFFEAIRPFGAEDNCTRKIKRSESGALFSFLLSVSLYFIATICKKRTNLCVS